MNEALHITANRATMKGPTMKRAILWLALFFPTCFAFAADASPPSQDPTGEKRPTRIWNRMGPLGDKDLPSTFSVEYVRAWKKKQLLKKEGNDRRCRATAAGAR
jgi:hypothetical protein